MLQDCVRESFEFIRIRDSMLTANAKQQLDDNYGSKVNQLTHWISPYEESSVKIRTLNSLYIFQDKKTNTFHVVPGYYFLNHELCEIAFFTRIE
jgi:hypothetical protein